MASGYVNSAGTDLDNLFYTSNSNGGAVGYVNSSNVDLGNKYFNGSTLGYGVGYANSAGTDLGYLRGTEPTTPTLINSAIIKIGIYRGYDPDGKTCSDGESSYACAYYGPSACYYIISGTISNYVPTHTYQLYIGEACWTTSQSHPCNYSYQEVSASLTAYQCLFNQGGSKANLPSNNGGQCGNSHSSSNTASDSAGGGARYVYRTFSVDKSFALHNVMYRGGEDTSQGSWVRWAIKVTLIDTTKNTSVMLGEVNYWSGYTNNKVSY